MKVSIIVPIFNAEPFLHSSVKSVQKQSHKNIEIILVNDASTDQSLLICKALAKSDCRILIVDKTKNEKALKARVSGLKNASGDFILFFDADDYMPVDAVEKLLSGQKRSDADITLGALVNYYDRFRLIKSAPRNLADGQLISDDYNEIEIRDKFSIAFFGLHSIPVTSPAKLFKRDLFIGFSQMDHPAIHAFDDTYLNLIVFREAKKISFIKDVVYYYRYGGYTSQLDLQLLPQLNEIHTLRKKILAQKPIDRAYEYSLIETKNTIYSFLLNSMLLKDLTFEQFERILLKIKHMGMYAELKTFLKNKDFTYSGFYNYVFSDDHEASYQLLLEDFKKVKVRRMTKRFIGKILRSL